MIDRRNRGTFPARGDISDAKLLDDGHAKSVRETLAIANLEGQARFGAMKDRLSMKSNRAEILGSAVTRKEGLERFYVGLRHQLDDAFRRRALSHHRAQRVAGRVAQRHGQGAAMLPHAFAIGGQCCDIHPVEGRSRHKAHVPVTFHNVSPGRFRRIGHLPRPTRSECLDISFKFDLARTLVNTRESLA